MEIGRRCRLRVLSSAHMGNIRQFVAVWTVPTVLTSALHLGLACGALGLSFGSTAQPIPQLAVQLVTLSPEAPEPVAPTPRVHPAPKPPPRAERTRTPAAQLPVVPPRPIESTPTATMAEEAPVAAEPKIDERRASAPPPVVEASPATGPPQPVPKEPAASAPKESAPQTTETVPVPPDRAPAPDPTRAQVANAQAPSSASPAPAPAPPGPRVAAVPPNVSGSELSNIARPRGGYQVVPSYPSAARRLGIEGTTLLRVLVLDDGRVGDIQIQKSAGNPELDRAAAEAVHRWRFDPARKGSAAVSTWVLLPVEFHLTR
jgi:periplasmic protein TonB